MSSFPLPWSPLQPSHMIPSTGSPIFSSQLILIWLFSLPLNVRFQHSVPLSQLSVHLWQLISQSLTYFHIAKQLSWHIHKSGRQPPSPPSNLHTFYQTNAPQMGPTLTHITAHHLFSHLHLNCPLLFLASLLIFALLDFFSMTAILWITLHVEFHCGLCSKSPVQPYFSLFI